MGLDAVIMDVLDERLMHLKYAAWALKGNDEFSGSYYRVLQTHGNQIKV